MTTCFVMQVFDGNGPYDRRFDETFSPAIKRGGANALRADKILGTKPVIEKIEAAIRDCTIAFAEITENNSNVFIELGYALSLDIPLVMVCDKTKRATLPFDISHRPVIFYKTESQGNFEELAKGIETSVAAALHEAATKRSMRPADTVSLRSSDGLKDRILLEVLESEIGNPQGLPAYVLKRALSADGVTERLTSLAALALTRDGLIESTAFEDRDGDGYMTYKLTESGKDLLLSRYAEIKQDEEAKQRPNRMATRSSPFVPDVDDDIPF
jgi:hypothetical protein